MDNAHQLLRLLNEWLKTCQHLIDLDIKLPTYILKIPWNEVIFCEIFGLSVRDVLVGIQSTLREGLDLPEVSHCDY